MMKRTQFVLMIWSAWRKEDAMLGFLRSLFDDGWQQDKIDNSPDAVAKRLAYLRLTRDDDYFGL